MSAALREQCSCGAAIEVDLRSGVANTIAFAEKWRTSHRHETPSDETSTAVNEPEPEMEGSHAQVERAGRRYFESESAYGHDVPIINAHRQIGFSA